MDSSGNGAQLYQNKVQELLGEAEKNLKLFVEYDAEYAKLEKFFSNVHKTTTVKHRVELGKLAFMEGELIHTNEVTVSLGDNWFVERSSTEAVAIVGRRREYTKEQIRKAETNLKELKTKFSMIVGLTDEDGHALNEEGLRFVDIRETEEEALQTELERKMLKGKQKDKPNASAVVENPNLGSFEREMLEKLAKYEEEGDDDEEEDEPANEEDDGDEDSENSDVPRNNSDSDIESEEEPVIAASTMKRAQLKPLIKPGTIKNPADIYKQMKALAGKESSEVIGEIEIGGGQKIAIKSEIPKKEDESRHTMKTEVFENEMEDYTESDFEEYLMQKEIAEEYFRKKREFFVIEDEEDDEDGRYANKALLEPEGSLAGKELLHDMLEYHSKHNFEDQLLTLSTKLGSEDDSESGTDPEPTPRASTRIVSNFEKPIAEKPKTNFIKPRITEFEKAKKLAAEIVPPEPKKVSRFKAESTKNRSVSGLQTEAARVTDILKSRVMDAARGVVIEKGESGLDGPQSTSTERNGERKKSSPITEVERIELLQQQLESTKKVSRFKVESAKNRALETALTEVNPRIADTTKPRVMDAARGAVVEKDERQPTSTEQVVLKKKGSFLTDAEVCKQVTEYESGFDDFVEAKKKMSPFKSAETSKRVTDKEPPVAEQAGPTKKVSKFKAAEAAKRGFDMRAPSDNIVEAQKKMSGVQAGDSLKKHGEGLAGSRVTNPVKPQITETIEPESIESTTGESAQPAKKVSLFKASRRHT